MPAGMVTRSVLSLGHAFRELNNVIKLLQIMITGACIRLRGAKCARDLSLDSSIVEIVEKYRVEIGGKTGKIGS